LTPNSHGIAIYKAHLLIELGPQQDPMFERLLRVRDALCGGLTARRTLEAFAAHFSACHQSDLGSGRTLFLMEKR
jgi:hypothetical protein